MPRILTGPVERGLRADLRKRGIKVHASTLAAAAIMLAQRIDKGQENGTIQDKDLIAAMRELRLTLAELVKQPGDAQDEVTDLADSAKKKLAA